jgi:hypothetical protein
MFPWMIRRNTRRPGKANWQKNSEKWSKRGGWYRVKVDMDRLRAHLAPGNPGKADERTLRKWLRQSGFQPRGDWWVVREAGLGQLAPSEVAASEPLD